MAVAHVQAIAVEHESIVELEWPSAQQIKDSDPHNQTANEQKLPERKRLQRR
jgi:hypothetical protein